MIFLLENLTCYTGIWGINIMFLIQNNLINQNNLSDTTEEHRAAYS